MGHPSGHLAHNIHFLRLAEFRLNGQALGHILPDGREVGAPLDADGPGMEADLAH